MVDAAISLLPLDVSLARETLLDALPVAVYFGASSTLSARDVACVAQTMTLPSAIHPTSVDLLLDALAELFASGFTSAAPLLRIAVAALRTDPEVRQFPRYLALGCWAAFALGDDDAVRSLGGECAVISRELGALQVLPEALSYLGQHELRVGSPTAADVYFAEQNDVQALVRRNGPGDVHRLMVSAWQGNESEVRAAAPVLFDQAHEFGIGFITNGIDYAIALLELGLGNYSAAATSDTETNRRRRCPGLAAGGRRDRSARTRR